MRIAFSNIAWARHDDPDVLSLLRREGITGIEVAPTRVWPNWEGATPAAAERYGKTLRGLGFDVPALQAVLFGRTQVHLFGEDGGAALTSHLIHVAELAGALGAQVVVLGAPGQRNRGSLTPERAFDRAAEVFRRLAEKFLSYDTCLCIEPNPQSYGCNFIRNTSEGAALVRRVNHRGFGLHLDSAAMLLEGEDLPGVWGDVGSLVRHFHISEPHLGNFCSPQVPHRANLDWLSSHHYAGWCSVEMRETCLPLSLVGPWSMIHAESCA